MLLAVAMVSVGSCLIGMQLGQQDAVRKLLDPQHERKLRERTLNEMEMSLSDALQKGQDELTRICAKQHRAARHQELVFALGFGWSGQ